MTPNSPTGQWVKKSLQKLLYPRLQPTTLLLQGVHQGVKLSLRLDCLYWVSEWNYSCKDRWRQGKTSALKQLTLSVLKISLELVNVFQSMRGHHIMAYIVHPSLWYANMTQFIREVLNQDWISIQFQVVFKQTMRICTAISQAGISHLAHNGGLDYMHVGSTIHRVIDYFTVSVHRPNSLQQQPNCLPFGPCNRTVCNLRKMVEIPTSHMSPQSIVSEAIPTYIWTNQSQNGDVSHTSPTDSTNATRRGLCNSPIGFSLELSYVHTCAERTRADLPFSEDKDGLERAVLKRTWKIGCWTHFLRSGFCSRSASALRPRICECM